MPKQHLENGDADLLLRLGKRIRDLRRAQNISQEHFASLARLDRAYFGRVERGQVNIAVLNLRRIAAALSVPVRALFMDGEVGDLSGSAADGDSIRPDTDPRPQ
jgi:transcriptional regulator with XRE-family HTH domain